MWIRLVNNLLSTMLMVTLLAVTSYSQQLDTLRTKAEADSLMMIGDSLSAAWQLQSALQPYESARKNYRSVGDDVNVAKAYHKLAKCQLYLGDFNSAIENWQVQLGLVRGLGDLRGESSTLNNIGIIHYHTSNYDEALKYYLASLEIDRKLGNENKEAQTLNNVAAIYSRMSDYSRMLDYLQKSLEICRRLGDRKTEGIILGNIGVAYIDIDDNSKALDCIQKSLDILREVGDRRSEANNLISLGNAYWDIDHDEALKCYQMSLDISRDLGEKLAMGDALGNIADIYRSASNFSEALTFYNESIKVYRELGKRREESRVLIRIGDVHFKIGDYETSKLSFKEAFTIAQDLNLNQLIAECYIGLGDCCAAQGIDSLSLLYLVDAVNVIDKIRGKLKVEAQRTGFTSRGMSKNAYESLILVLLRSKRDDDAYNYTERARARSFLDLLASGDVQVGNSRHAEFLQQEEELYTEEEGIEDQISGAGEDTVQVSMFRSKMHDLRESRKAIVEEKKLYEPELASMVTVNPLTLPEVQEIIDPKSTILEYFLTEEKTLIWMITKDEAKVLQVDIGGDSLKTLVEGFRAAIKGTGAVEKRSKGLYDLLIAPVENEIKTKNLVIVPHGILHYLPFQALQNRKGKYLIEKYKISYLPSASVMKYLEPKRRPRGKRLLAFGNPMTDREGYGSIPQSEQEVQDLAELYETREILTGEDAKESKFKELAPNYDILHLACHGELNSAYPLFSGLLLTPGEDQDGELDVYELFTLDLNAYLVVLSACETGLGHLTTGDELVGLSRAFIYAGTPSVISSLWQVKDESTAYLMKQFYSNLQKYNKVDALRKAQLKTKKKYDDVVSWASFVLIGDVD